MEYKAYYTFKAITPDNEVSEDSEDWEINFDWVNVGRYRFDVTDADGFNWVGNTVDCAGSFYFDCEVFDEDTEDYESGGEIDWETIDESLKDLEATFSLYDEEGEPARFGDEDNDPVFELTIVDNNSNKHTGKTGCVFEGNM